MKHICLMAGLALILPAAVFAQQGSTGSIAGTVSDPSGQVVPGATVKLTSELNGESRTVLTNESGDFFFGAVTPAAYTVRVEASGFRPLEQKGNIVAASGRLALGKIQLEVGSVSESVVVTAQGAAVATTTTAQATTIDSTQMELIAVKGRDPMSVFKTLPGVTVIADQDTWGGSYQSTVPTFQGRGGNTVYTDGVNGGDGGGGGNFSGITSIDAIAEVNIQGNSYTAEYGLKGGAQVNMVTKHGGDDYHGSLAWYKRHEQFNAQNYFNNRTGAAKPRYRYSDISGTFGGRVPLKMPILNPDGHRFNFFYSVEDMRLKDVNQLRQYTMPTALERAGDFSQTKTPQGALVVVRDPLTGQPFANNVIPTARRDSQGVAFLTIFPLPNVTGGAGYNYLSQESSIDHPRRAQLFRFDIRPTDKDTVSIKYQNWFTKSVGWEVAGRSSPWGLVRQRYDFTADQGKVEYTRVITPHLVNEASIGIFYSTEIGPPEDALALASIQKANDRLAALGDCAPPKACPATGSIKPGNPMSGLRQIAPGNNPLGLIPKATFGTLQNNSQAVPDIAYDNRWPIDGADSALPIQDNITYTHGAHIFKAGVLREAERFAQARASTFGGSFDFNSTDANDTSNTGFAYANAFIGHVTTYNEQMGRPPDNRRQFTWAWFVQDTFKARRNLTIDVGLRMYKWGPALQGGHEASAFSFSRFDPKWGGKPPVLYTPTCIGAFPCSGTNRKALNPITKETLPASFIGLMVPGTGYSCGPITPTTPCAINGIVVQDDPTYSDVGHGFINKLPIQFDPRFGVAWDPQGDGKMVVRAAFGSFHDPTGGPTEKGGPAYNFTQTIRYTDMNSYFTGVGPTSPASASGWWLDGNKRPVTYQYNFGIQRDIGFKTVVDVAYVGSITHNNNQTYNYNVLPAGARFLPQNRDLTVASSLAVPGALPDALLRPIPGYLDVNMNSPATTSRYDSMQVAVNRRFLNGVQLSGAYTWAGGTSNGWNQNNPLPSSVQRSRNTNVQKHAVVLSYTVDLPKGSKLIHGGAVAKQVFDYWQLQGVSTMTTGLVSDIGSGTPMVATFSDNFDFSGGGETCGLYTQTGNAVLSRDARGVDNWFDASVFKRPSGRGDIGNNCNNGKFILPGFHNHDLSLFKKFPLKNEKHSLEFRWETFNTFNHTQFSTVGLALNFDAAGRQTNGTFGKVTAARDGRKMMFGLKFSF
jgi:hypothetical protein